MSGACAAAAGVSGAGGGAGTDGGRPCADVAGMVLAGGLARRMGGRHKALLKVAGKPLIEHVLERLRPQVALVAISANEQRERLAGLDGVEAVLPDVVPGHAGPLAGILTGLLWVREWHPEMSWLLSVAVDTPFFPRDLCARLRAAVEESGAEIAVACSDGRMHPVFALWPVALTDELGQALREEGLRKVEAFMARRALVRVRFEAGQEDPFFNVNTPEDLRLAEKMPRRR